MQEPQRSTLDELFSSPAVARLATALQRVRVISLDQIQRYECLWGGLYRDESPRRRRQFIRSDLQQLTRAGFLQCLSTPAIWPSPIAENPTCRFSLLEESLDFESGLDHLDRRLEGAAVRKVRVYAAPTRNWDLAPRNFPHSTRPHSVSNRILEFVDFETTFDTLSREAQLPTETETVPSLDIAQARKFLSFSLSTAILSLSEIYCTLADRHTPQICDWSLMTSPFIHHRLADSTPHRPIGYAAIDGRFVAVVFAPGLTVDYLCEIHEGIKINRITYPVDEIQLW